MNSRRVFYCIIALSATSAVFLLASCSNPAAAPSSMPYYITPISAIDAQCDSDLLAHLLDGAVFHTSSTYRRPEQIQFYQSQADLISIQRVLAFALSKVSTDSASHIPYLWGGKHADKPTKWSDDDDWGSSSHGDSNNDCPARIGLDCSGFIQYIFDATGLGRQAPELNVASLVNPANWNFMKKNGYTIAYLDTPKISDLQPGDLVFFKSSSGSWSHIGMFWGDSENVNGTFGPAFVSSVGVPDCDSDFTREKNGRPTGVSVALINNSFWQTRLKAAIRFVNNFITFNANGYRFFADFPGPYIGAVDTTTGFLQIIGCNDTPLFAPSVACIEFFADSAFGPGTYQIKERKPGDSFISEFNFPSSDNVQYDSLLYLASTPSTGWHGPTPPSTGGTVTIQTFAKSGYEIAATGTFDLNVNSYYSRWIDSTFYIDTTKVTQKVEVYRYLTTEVTGNFGGVIGRQ